MSHIVYNFYLFVAIKLKFGAMIASIWINFQAKLIYIKASGNPQSAQDFFEIPHTWYQRNGVKSLPEFATKVWLSPLWIPNSPMWITSPSLWKVSLHSATLHSYSFNYQQQQRYCYSSQLANVRRMIDKLLCIKWLVSLTYQNKHNIFTIRTPSSPSPNIFGQMTSFCDWNTTLYFVPRFVLLSVWRTLP